MFIKCHYIFFSLILTGAECFVQSPVDIAKFFNLSVFSFWSIYIVLLGLMKFIFEHRYHGSALIFNHILTSLEYII